MGKAEKLTRELLNNYLIWTNNQKKEDNISNYIYWYTNINKVDIFKAVH